MVLGINFITANQSGGGGGGQRTEKELLLSNSTGYDDRRRHSSEKENPFLAAQVYLYNQVQCRGVLFEFNAPLILLSAWCVLRVFYFFFFLFVSLSLYYSWIVFCSRSMNFVITRCLRLLTSSTSTSSLHFFWSRGIMKSNNPIIIQIVGNQRIGGKNLFIVICRYSLD